MAVARIVLMLSLALSLIASFCLLGSAGFSAGYEAGYGSGYMLNTGIAELEKGPRDELASVPDDGTGDKEQGEALVGNDIIQLKDPSFAELRHFILADITNQNRWVENTYECRHFTTDVCNHAREAGWNSAFVLICYSQGQHSVVAFNTTDRGLVYIEPQTDAVIHPETGGMYQGKEIDEILVAW